MKTEMKTEMKWDEMLALTFLTQVEIERIKEDTAILKSEK